MIAVDVLLINDLFSTLTYVKIAAAVFMVVLLSVLAEVVSPRFAGIFSGYPLGAAISLFFMGVEISPGFAAESALYTSLGLISTQVFAYCYYKASSMAGPRRGGVPVLLASLAGVSGYFLAASLLRVLPVDIYLATLLPSCSIVVFHRLFKGVENTRIQNRVGMNLKVLLLRSMFAAFAIILITTTAKVAGPKWAGLFAAFPVTMFPFLVIMHFSYEPGHVHAILKNVPVGLGALIIYSVAVSVFYPSHGVYTGTVIAYALATVYLVLTQMPRIKPVEKD